MNKGARFYKCDLHVQTPADARRWLGEPMGTAPDEQNAAAEQFVRRCYEERLEVIGITDHNFASRSFIPLLQRAAAQFDAEFGYELAILPGFEFQADVGKGLHVLCIFDSSADLEVVDRILAECGVPAERFHSGDPLPSTKRLPEILDAVQQKHDGRYRGIVICPHSQAEAGIFDTERIAEWLQAEEFRNPKLLCVEVPKPTDEMSNGWQRLFVSGDDCDPAWKRSRPIACILSSDAKALRATEAENCIGRRHTWIKLGKPSVEGLRHAFLAHESRICLRDPVLPSCYITRMEVGSCKFFAARPFVVDFNRQFTAIIGGRGTGKSTVLEYLRWALCDQPVDINTDDPLLTELPAYAKKRASLIDGTLKSQPAERAYVRVVFVLNETEHVVTRHVHLDRLTLRIGAGEEREVSESDVRRVVRIQAYSQKQLSTVSVRLEELRRLIEAPVRDEVRAFNERIADKRETIREFFQRLWKAKDLERRVRSSEAQVASIKAQIETLKKEITGLSPEDQSTLDRHGDYVAEDQLVQRVEADIKAIATAIEDARAKLAPLPRDASVACGLPQREIIGRIVLLAFQAKAAADESLIGASEQVKRAVTELSAEKNTWKIGFDDHTSAFAAAKDRAASYTEQLSKIEALTKRVSDIEKQLDELRGKRNEIRIDPTNEEQQLTDWYQLHKDRGDVLEGACNSVNEQSQGDIRVFLNRGADADRAFGLLRDRLAGTRARSDWIENLAQSVVCAANPAPDWTALLREFQPLAELREEDVAGTQLPTCPRLSSMGFTDATIRNIATKLQAPEWLELLLTSLEDRPEFFYRVDETQEIRFEEASPGQQATALLTVLLNQGGGPLIIDQPEEDLDNAIIS